MLLLTGKGDSGSLGSGGEPKERDGFLLTGAGGAQGGERQAEISPEHPQNGKQWKPVLLS